jgi:metal-responsive CopG/Arc/MetJ family transcriptional regulator
MAKVMISIPDDLLERIDAQVEAEHATRSGFLQRLAEHELAATGQRQQRRIEELLGEPVRLGGDATKLIREDRESR